MHDEMCRKCGGMLTNWSLCSECRKPIKRICLQCGSHTEELVHSMCFYHIESLQMEGSVGFDALRMEKTGKVILHVESNELNPLLNEIA